MSEGTPLKNILKELISELGKKEKEETDILKTWEKTVGEKGAKHTKPVFLKTQKLVVNVDNSPWLYKLTTEKSKLIMEFNKNLKKRDKIKQLQFRIGDIKG